MKKCPYCAEMIQDEAIVCRFCDRDQPSPPNLSPSPTDFAPISATVSAPRPGNSRTVGCAILAGLLVIAAIARFSTALERAQFKEKHPNPTTLLSCESCRGGIPIYDSWSTTREIIAHGQNGEECEVSANYTRSYIATLQPRAQYTYIDTEPHLYVRCPSGGGFVYTSHTTFTE